MDLPEANSHNDKGPPSGSGPACNSVLGTVELLESILSSLPVRNLFVVQAVSKTWKQTIAQSPRIQVMMFFRCRSRRRKIWEMVNEQLERMPIMATESDSTNKDYVIKARIRDVQRRPGYRKYVTLRRIVAADTIEGQDHLILPLRLNPRLKAPSSYQRVPLVEADLHGVYSTVPYANMTMLEDLQRVEYSGSIATLERIADMYVSDPPWPEASMEITVIFREAGARPQPGFIEVVIYGIDIESKIGLKMADVLQGLSQRGSHYAEITHGPLRGDKILSPYDYKILCMEQVTMAELPFKVKCDRLEDAGMRRDIKVSLRFPPIDGLLPIVPGKVERRAIRDGRATSR